MKTHSFSVTGREDRLPLVDLIALRMKISKKAAKRIIDDKLVTVNGKPVWMARHPMKPRDEVRLRASVGPRKEKLKILLETRDLVVAMKPDGMLSTGKQGVEGRLQEQLNCPALRLVHRLDRDTSGCLLLAKNETIKEALMDEFKARKVRKEYHAIAYGKITGELTVINEPLEDKAALSKIKIISTNKRASHVRVRILTGRTHQIRKHLFSIHHPVVGDREYFLRPGRDRTPIDAPRQMLHAARLVFVHPVSGERIDARAPLPRDFRAVLKQLDLA